MKYRLLGRTQLNVSEVGFGAWGIGKTSWIGANDEASLDALKAARDVGINLFDTALAYGGGHSERLIASAFGRCADIFIASKAPPENMEWPARNSTRLREAYSKRHVLDCLAQTLRNLGRETIDLYQFHVWSDNWAAEDEWLDTVETIRRSGAARFIGISINDHEPTNVMHALGTSLIDSIQTIYNIFDQSPEDELFPYCLSRNIGVLARVPFDEGSLAGIVRSDTVFPAGDFRNRYFAGGRKQDVWGRVLKLTEDMGMPISQLPALALSFCLAHPAVSTVIPGMRTDVHVKANAQVSDRSVVSPAIATRLRRHRWIRNYYGGSAAAS